MQNFILDDGMTIKQFNPTFNGVAKMPQLVAANYIDAVMAAAIENSA